MPVNFRYLFQKLKAAFSVKVLFLSFALLSNMGNSYASNKEDLLEVKLKLAFIYKFVEFIDGKWNFATKDGRIIIAIHGDLDAQQKKIVRQYEDKKLRGLPVTIKFNPSNSSAKNSDVVFFTEGSKDKVKSVLANTRKDVLSVGDTTYFLDKGGVVEFYSYRGKVRFRINNAKAKKKSIYFNAKLLELAEVR